MRKPAVLFLALAAAGVTLHAQTSCPAYPVPGNWAHVVNDCDTRLCSPASEVTLTIAPQTYCPQPGPPCLSPYNLQACDTVRWRFDDGSPDVIAVGQPSIKHFFSGVGMKTPSAVVTNTLSPNENASETQVYGDNVYIVDDPPSRVAFTRTQYDVNENGGSVTITLTRSGNLSRTSTVAYSNFEVLILPPPQIDRIQVVNGSVVFAPGESTKTFSVEIYDDTKYTGDQYLPIRIFGFDGTLFDELNRATATIHVLENDYPTLSASPGLLTMRVGESATVVFSLSPARDVPLEVALSATQLDWLVLPSTITVPPGGSATMTVRALRVANGTIRATSNEANAAIAVDVVAGAPRIDSIAPNVVPTEGSSRVAINGANLSAACSVTFGGAAGTNVIATPGGITALAPPHAAGYVDVTVSCGGATTVVRDGLAYGRLRRRTAGS
jgi:hypothetical protein